MYSTKHNDGFSSVALIAILAIGAVATGVIITMQAPADDEGTPVTAETRTGDARSGAEAIADSIAETAVEPIADLIEPASPGESDEAMDSMMDEDMADASMSTETEAATPLETSATPDAATPEIASETAVTATPGVFIDYDPALLAAGQTNVLFFHADWCPTCRGLENDLNASLSDIPENVAILKLNYDNETELKKKYGVIRQHTLVVVDSNGNEIKKLTGLTNTLEQVVNQL